MKQDTANLVVKIYSVLFWLFAFVYVGVGLAIIFGGSALSAIVSGSGEADADLLAAALGVFGVAFGIALVVLGIIDGFAANGLWQRKEWARILAIVLFVLSLFSFPFGTIFGGLGIYFFGFDETVKGLFKRTTAKTASAKKRTVKKRPSRKKAAKAKKK